jgi:hypothetical protein
MVVAAGAVAGDEGTAKSLEESATVKCCKQDVKPPIQEVG